jgi:hypothetical protein
MEIVMLALRLNLVIRVRQKQGHATMYNYCDENILLLLCYIGIVIETCYFLLSYVI